MLLARSTGLKAAAHQHRTLPARAPAGPQWRAARRAHTLRVRASEGDKEQDKRKNFEELVAKQLDALKKAGMSPQAARQTLKTWADLGAKNEKELRDLLLKRSLRPIQTLVAQLALDVFCSAGAFTIGSNLGRANLPAWGIGLQIIAYFGGCWYAIQALAEAGALGAIVVTARRYSTDSEAILAAVQQLAGPSSGVGLVDSTKLAANTLALVRVLQGIGEELKGLSASGKLERSTLKTLSAFLTLQSAKEKYGFDASKYGLTDEQAADIAAVFSEFDANDDGRLELSELRRLVDLVGKDLSDDELKAAIKLLGSRDGQNIYFVDFAEWYLGLRPSSAGQPASPEPAATP